MLAISQTRDAWTQSSHLPGSKNCRNTEITSKWCLIWTVSCTKRPYLHVVKVLRLFCYCPFSRGSTLTSTAKPSYHQFQSSWQVFLYINNRTQYQTNRSKPFTQEQPMRSALSCASSSYPCINQCAASISNIAPFPSFSKSEFLSGQKPSRFFWSVAELHHVLIYYNHSKGDYNK